MDMNEYTISLSLEYTSSNEEWRKIIDEGMPAPEVTGGEIKLPQGGIRRSRASVIGGIFTEGSVAATYAEENCNKILSAILPEEIHDHIYGLIDGSYTEDELSVICTNIAKTEYMITANESQSSPNSVRDNPDENQATQNVIDSLQVKVVLLGLPSKREIIEDAKPQIASFISEYLGGDSL